MGEFDTTIDTRGLEAILKALKNPPMARVGILSTKTHSPETPPKKGSKPFSLTNAQLGAMHEFGGPKVKQRSFLKMPITLMLDKRLKKSGILDEANLRKLIATRSAANIVRLIAVIAESIVRDAFQTGGFGQWTPSNMKRKKVQMTLLETQQLRDSITSEVDG